MEWMLRGVGVEVDSEVTKFGDRHLLFLRDFLHSLSLKLTSMDLCIPKASEVQSSAPLESKTKAKL